MRRSRTLVMAAPLALALPILLGVGDIFGIPAAVIGIGLLIFVHEAGHFFVAKWSGVKVEAFSLGFPPTAIGIRRRGGRLHVLWWPKPEGGKGFSIPFFGSADDPTEYRIGLLPLGGYVKMAGEAVGEGEGAPDELKSKGVLTRGAIFGAGVAMNALTAIVLFVIAFQIGVPLAAPVIGRVEPGSPAEAAGFLVGDRIRAIDGAAIGDFSDVKTRIAFAPGGHGLVVGVERAGKMVTLGPVVPEWHKAEGLYVIGVEGNVGGPVVGLLTLPSAGAAGLKVGDRILAVQGTSVGHLVEINAAIAKADGAGTITLAVDRRGERREITLSRPDRGPPMIGVELDQSLGARIESLPANSGLVAAGLTVGDALVSIADKNVATVGVTAARRAGGGADAPAVVRRDGAERTLTLPTQDAAWEGVTARVALGADVVRPGSAAAEAGLKAGERIVALDGAPFDGFEALQARVRAAGGTPVVIGVEPAGGGAVRSITVTPRVSAPTLADLGVATHPLEEVVVLGLVPAVRRGISASGDIAKQIYQMLRGLVARRVSTGNLGGPIAIVGTTAKLFGKGLGLTLYFLGILSVNLAVLNLLPIPVLDGGHLFFLAIEAVRRKPVSEGIQIASQYVGLFLLLGLMLFVTVQDIIKLF